MVTKNNQEVIAIEEHYWDPLLAKHFDKRDAGYPGAFLERMENMGERRLKEMDAAGIDVQVLSHCPPATQLLDAQIAAHEARAANDRLAHMVSAHPNRFAGFAALPTPDPEACADELERTVTKLGFKGGMIHGLTHGLFFDDKRFWPVFERAQALDVPLYMHPANPHPAVVEAYYKDYLQDYPSLLNAGWGFTVETATQAIRLVLSGVFDAYPNVKIVLGHLGEGLPFLLWRMDSAFARPGNKPLSFREVFSQHFYITTSGNFSDPALLCCIQELGVDRILFSVDYPFVENGPGTAWMERLQLSSEDKAKILNGNARRLLHL